MITAGKTIIDASVLVVGGSAGGGGHIDDGDGLAGMAEDVFGFGVVLRLLMQFFDAGHLFPGLGCFDAISTAIPRKRNGRYPRSVTPTG